MQTDLSLLRLILKSMILNSMFLMQTDLTIFEECKIALRLNLNSMFLN